MTRDIPLNEFFTGFIIFFKFIKNRRFYNEVNDKDNEAVDYRNHRALVATHEDRGGNIAVCLRKVADLIVAEYAKQDARCRIRLPAPALSD